AQKRIGDYWKRSTGSFCFEPGKAYEFNIVIGDALQAVTVDVNSVNDFTQPGINVQRSWKVGDFWDSNGPFGSDRYVAKLDEHGIPSEVLSHSMDNTIMAALRAQLNNFQGFATIAEAEEFIAANPVTNPTILSAEYLETYLYSRYDYVMLDHIDLPLKPVVHEFNDGLQYICLEYLQKRSGKYYEGWEHDKTYKNVDISTASSLYPVDQPWTEAKAWIASWSGWNGDDSWGSTYEFYGNVWFNTGHMTFWLIHRFKVN
ncbi:MAG: hypothetical protein LBH19_06635, partial [Dysgonamonadaceae bacterium]|nr:hypothetical protein [Dysgonamonadaceae bacterium]